VGALITGQITADQAVGRLMGRGLKSEELVMLA
jgi:hypothetical protein